MVRAMHVQLVETGKRTKAHPAQSRPDETATFSQARTGRPAMPQKRLWAYMGKEEALELTKACPRLLAKTKGHAIRVTRVTLVTLRICDISIPIPKRITKAYTYSKEVVISEGVVKEVSQFKYLGSVLVTDGRLDVELNIRRGKAVGRFKQFEKMWGTKHLSLATKVKCYKAYVLPILLFGSECWSLTKVQSQKLERVHSSCLRSILGVRLSDRHTNEHIRKSCGVATLSAYITANRLRWLGHVGRMEEGRLPHIALFSSLHGDMTRPVGRPRHTWEKCVCADLKVLGQDEGSWEASCQIKSAWRKRLWDLTHPWESQRLARCRRRTKQAIDKHVERYVVPFSGWEDGGSPVPRWWVGATSSPY